MPSKSSQIHPKTISKSSQIRYFGTSKELKIHWFLLCFHYYGAAKSASEGVPKRGPKTPTNNDFRTTFWARKRLDFLTCVLKTIKKPLVFIVFSLPANFSLYVRLYASIFMMTIVKCCRLITRFVRMISISNSL